MYRAGVIMLGKHNTGMKDGAQYPNALVGVEKQRLRIHAWNARQGIFVHGQLMAVEGE